MAPSPEEWPKTHHPNDGLTKYGGRDMLGYGEQTPVFKWPKGAKVALNFVINYEEGGEKCILHGDNESEVLISEIMNAEAYENERNLNMESIYDYGSRSGFWRLHRCFTRRKVPATVFAVGMALERNPGVCQALREATDWEVASHGYRWMDYRKVDEETEREHMKRTIEIHEKLVGKRPMGFYIGKPSPNTRRIVVEEGNFKYDSDAYDDDLPYWRLDFQGKLHLIIPYTLSENDMRFASPNGFNCGSDFAKYLKESLRFLVEEARPGQCKMMTVGLHCRLARPGRVAGIAEFIDFAKSYGREVWICTREEIADFWFKEQFPKGAGSPMKSNVQMSFGEIGGGSKNFGEIGEKKFGEIGEKKFGEIGEKRFGEIGDKGVQQITEQLSDSSGWSFGGTAVSAMGEVGPPIDDGDII